SAGSAGAAAGATAGASVVAGTSAGGGVEPVAAPVVGGGAGRRSWAGAFGVDPSVTPVAVEDEESSVIGVVPEPDDITGTATTSPATVQSTPTASARRPLGRRAE
ncbi:MAG: hypothetical protein M3Q22_16435, partial [Actinomycetota bacterium]|nr:hypothetical protein [Actinomycetota bacterium]